VCVPVGRLCGLVIRAPGYRSRGPGFDSRRYEIFWEVVGLERGPLSLMGIIEELLGRKSSGSGLENRDYGRGDSLRWPLDTLYPQKLELTSTTSGGRSGWYSCSPADSGHGVCLCVCVCVRACVRTFYYSCTSLLFTSRSPHFSFWNQFRW
jgi:hypothetical protein